MQVHCDDMIAAGCLQHVRHELRSDRCTGSVFLVLASIGEVRDHGGDTTRGCGLAGVDDDEEFHEAVIDVARSGGLEDKDFIDNKLVGISDQRRRNGIPSSSRTDSPMVTEVS